jgi:Tn3 transposase DDE domain
LHHRYPQNGKNLSPDERVTVSWHLSLDNIIAVNDRLLDFMDRLVLPNLVRHSADRLHTSSGGQKFEVRADSLNANYSYKYFGKSQGVSAYTFRDKRDLLWYSLVFSSADRESAYVIDGLMHNEVVLVFLKSTYWPSICIASVTRITKFDLSVPK